MRFTFLNPKRKAPFYHAKYDAYVFASLAIAQVLSITFAILLLWKYLIVFDPVFVGTAVLVLLAVAFFLSYSSVQNSHVISLISIFGIEALSLEYIPLWYLLQIGSLEIAITTDDFLLLIALLDFIIITIIFYVNTVFPPHAQKN